MVDAQGQVQVLADGDLVAHHPWFLGNAADHHGQGEIGQRDRPASTLSEHAHRSHQDRAGELTGVLRHAHHKPVEDAPHESGQEKKPFEELCLHGGMRLALAVAHLLVDFQQGLLVGGSENVWHGESLTILLDLEHGIDPDLVEDHQAVAPVTVSAQMCVLLDRPAEAVDHEGRKREFFASFLLNLSDDAASLGDVHFQQAVHHVPVAAQVAGVECESPHAGNILELICIFSWHFIFQTTQNISYLLVITHLLPCLLSKTT